MEEKFCPYCGAALEEHCNCMAELQEQRERLMEEIEERQHESGFYVFQDLIAMYRFER